MPVTEVNPSKMQTKLSTAELHELAHLMCTTRDELFNCLTTRTMWAEVPVCSNREATGCQRGYPMMGTKSGPGSTESVPPTISASASSTTHWQLSSHHLSHASIPRGTFIYTLIFITNIYDSIFFFSFIFFLAFFEHGSLYSLYVTRSNEITASMKSLVRSQINLYTNCDTVYEITVHI
jgi:hypothetical protein